MTIQTPTTAPADAAGLAETLARRCTSGERFAGLYATSRVNDTRLTALLATDDDIEPIDVTVRGDRYPALCTHACPPHSGTNGPCMT